MFTGIVEERGTFAGRDGGRFRFHAAVVLEDVFPGASLAANGVCLTVVASGADWWEADVVEETLSRTTLGALRPGDPVNFERPVRLADRLGGHLVQGHVDGMGSVVTPAPELTIAPPAPLMAYLAEKGSVAVDGVSLTVARMLDDAFVVAVIPHTAAVTTLGSVFPGDHVNLEVDLIARYVARHLGR